MTTKLCQHGFEVVDGVLDSKLVDELIWEFGKHAGETREAGIRQPHVSIAKVANLVGAAAIRGLFEPILGTKARVVRSILFDKTAGRNWGVAWHQDLTIAVEERREVAGFVGWSVKDGVNHVQAPREVLEGMLTVRVHLDDCGVENGPLRVLPGTHRDGWLDAEGVERAKREVKEEVCLVRSGGVVLMRPLLLHASSRATKPGHRRVLHLEFAAGELPGGLRFYSGDENGVVGN